MQLKDQDVAWEVVEEGDAEKELLKKMIQDQQETFNKRGRGRGTAHVDKMQLISVSDALLCL